KTLYSIDGDDYVEGTTFTVTGEGAHKITFYSIDKAGNTETSKTSYVNIDKTPPIISLNLASEYTVGSVLPAYTASDTLSGIANEKMIIFKPNDTIGKVIINDTGFTFDEPGIYTVYITVADAVGLTSTLEKRVLVKPLAELSDKDIQVLSRDVNQSQEFNNTLYPQIKIKNISNKEINLSNMQLKYFFTNEGNGDSIFECDWAGLNHNAITGNVKGNFVRDNLGDSTLTISFQGDKKLKPGEELEIQGRIHDPNWKVYNRFNDYSLNTADYSKNDRISVYYKNIKVCGTEPTLDTQNDAQITNSDFTLLSADANQQTQYNNTLYPRIKIKNISKKQIKFSDVKIMYFFTNDGNPQNIFACDNLSLNNKGMTNNIKSDFTSGNSGNTVLTLSFNNDGKIFMPGDEIEIQGRIYNSNWKVYNRFNDYSLNKDTYSPTDKVCLYVQGIRVNGVEP
ncbi:cellulose binding domain-containing protein, partial [uncultured Clostridium sp.]|uniref:cellulose binding domain-containing protein n=1 Tax=uncultured Clostridium sp. TaxID=59620 RepID=UPI0028ECF2EA